ncbi:hypothetical protein BD779DRAFT_1525345 [Infundibulicybe gibba]|nr:hypothetical protein BD779DRAFT_1525345 [Infundibulicybe gibba]
MIFRPTLYLPAIRALTGLLGQSVSVAVLANANFQAPTPAAATELAMTAAAATVATTKKAIEKPVSAPFDPSAFGPTPFAALYSTLLAPTSILTSATPAASALWPVTTSPSGLSLITSLASTSIFSFAVPSEVENIIDTETGPSDPVSACPIYTGADAIDISSRELAQLASRAGEEFWFRYEDPSVTDPENGILQLAPRPGAKNFDDQAYKWISTNAAKIKRGSMRGRIPAIYVLPAGTHTSEAKEAVGFVTKDNEPGDVGINGIQPENGVLPLDAFRDKIIRTVVKTVSGKAGGKEAFATISRGKVSKTASKSDQALLNKITC